MKRSRRRLLSIALAIALVATPPSFVGAEDIDLFIGSNTSTTAERPNVLFIIDNSANWAANSQHWVPDGLKQGQSELTALKTVVGELNDQINVGLMMLTAGTGGGAKDGAYMRFAIRQMTTANKAGLQQMIGDDTCDDTSVNSVTGTQTNCIYKNFFSGTKSESVGTNVDYSATLFEAFKYFGGFTNPANAKTDIAGTPVVTTVPSDGFGPYRYSGNPDGREDPHAYTPLAVGASTATNRNTYLPPISDQNSCAKNYIIFIGNGFPTQDAPSTLLSGVQGATTPQLSMPLFTTATTTQTATIGQSCGSGNNNNNRLSNCTANIPQSLKDANAGFDTYACIGTGVVDATCPGADNRKFDVQASKTVITVTPTGTSAVPASNVARFADEWTKYLFTTDVNGSPTDNVGGQLGAPGQQNVRTYTIDVFKDAQDDRQTSLLFNMAKVGGGKYFQATSPQGILDAIRSIITEIQAVNSVFAAASLPVSATNRAQNENQVFFGLFRPDSVPQPRWYGNLKRYQIAKDAAGQLILAGINVDATGQPVNAISLGFFDACAASFWTTDSGTYWNFSADSAGSCSAATIYSDLPDGRLVEKGGAAEVVRKGNDPPTTQTAPTFTVNRTMYTCADTATCPAATSPFMVTFDTTNVTPAAVGAGLDTALRDKIVNYTRGQDVNGETIGSTTDTRASIHGDVVHSRPLPINHGGSTGIVAYYGGNDGPLRAVRTSDGKELWSFIAPEHHSKLARLTDNSPFIAYPNVPSTLVPTPQKKDYFFDGTMGLYQTFDDTTKPPTVTTAWIFPTQRRGGRMVYGFDVTAPETPMLKWRVGCPNLTDDAGCTAGFDGIGQTWSFPNVAKIKGYTSGTAPVIVIGGGYDNCEDTDGVISDECNSAKGKKVYVIDANDGSLIASFATDRSVAADVAMIDRDFDGNADHAYVADMGGNLYRIDFINPATLASLASDAWTITKIANTSAGSGRKFLFPPAVLVASDRTFLTIGSGDREHPLSASYPFTTPVANRFYTFMDTFPAITSPATVVDLDGTNMLDFTSVTTTAPAECLTPTSARNGWRMDLVAGTGEQTVTSSLIAGGNVLFNTNRPTPVAPGVCSPDLGEARGYSVNLLCGTKFSVVYEGGGLPISPVLGTTTLADGSVVTFIIGGAGDPNQTDPYTPGQVKPVIAPTRSRLFWYRQGDK